MQSTVETLNQILAETKTKTIGLTAEEYFLNAEEENDGYAEKYGLLYTYDAALKALPDGWRLPTDEDWKNWKQNFIWTAMTRIIGTMARETGRYAIEGRRYRFQNIVWRYPGLWNFCLWNSLYE